MKEKFQKLKNQFSVMKSKFSKITNIVKKGSIIVKSKVQKLIKWEPVAKVIRFVKIPFVGYLLLACTLNFLLEVLSRHSFKKAFIFIGDSPTIFFYNAFIIFVTLSLVLFAKRKVFATIFVCVAWFVSAFANYIVLSFRTTPFSAIDILMIRNVMTMLDKYMAKWQMVVVAILIVLLIVLLVYLYIRLPKSKNKRNPFRASAYVCMAFVMIYTLTKVAVNTQTISDNFGNLAYAYNDYGFAYCFSNSIIDVGISKPRDYSEERIQEIVEDLDYNKEEVPVHKKEILNESNSEQVNSEQQVVKNNQSSEMTDSTIENTTEAVEEPTSEELTSEKEELSDYDKTLQLYDVPKKQFNDINIPSNDVATKEYPNVIVLQLESIFDTKYMKNFFPMETPMPTYAKLKREFSSGLFTVPAVGAGTANTEFEVQTGMSTEFFGAGEYPFKTVMRDTTCGSMAYDLKRFGYATAGFHNNDATFYERYVDYSNLGFDVFAGMEHMYQLNYTPRGWAKDDVLDDIMLERMLQTEGRDYITTISVQAHGRYPSKYTKTLHDLDCFFTGQYENDYKKKSAWQYYINMCRETDNMIKDLIKKVEEIDEPTVIFMYGDHLPSLNLEETDLRDINLYQTEWVMWDNLDLPVENKDLYAYQSSSYIFDRLDLEGGLMQNFHAKYMNQDNEKEYMKNLELLEYDTLYGNRYAYDQTNPFPQVDMKMGVRDIVVDKCKIVRDEVWIYGKGFNEFSEVYIDGKKVHSKQMSYAILRISLKEIKNKKELYVAQAGDDHIVLSVSNTIELNEDEIEEVTTTELSTEPLDENTVGKDMEKTAVDEGTTKAIEGTTEE